MNLEIIEQFEEFDELRDVQLDKMVDVSFSQLVLKQNFELIIKVLRGHRLSLLNISNGIKDFQKLIPSQSDIDQLKEQLAEQQERIAELEKNSLLHDKFIELQKSQQQLNEKQKDFEQLLSQLKDRDNAQQDEIDNLSQQFKDLEEKQKLLNQLKSSDGNENNVSSELIIELQQQINKMKANLNDINQQFDKYALKNELDKDKQDLQETKEELLEKINQLQNEISELKSDLHDNYTLDSKFQDLNQDVINLTSQFQSLRDSYLPEKFNDIELNFENQNSEIQQLKFQISQLYDLLNNMNKDSGIKEIQVPVIQPPPQIDNSKLKNLEGKIKQLEAQGVEINAKLKENDNNIKLVRDDMKKNVQKLSDEKMDKTENKQKEIFDQFNSLRERINTINNQLQTTDFLAKQNADEIKQLFDKLSQKKTSINQIAQQRKPSLTQEQIYQLIKDQVDQLNDDLMKLINEILQQLPLKATKEGLQLHEDMMKKIIDEILVQLKTLADKAETKKSFVYLEKKINEIYQLAMQDKKENDCDGLLAKKQLGWSCASCDKELDKYKGQLGDYINWAVFPRKETSPIFALHYANDIAKKAHETAYYKNFETKNNFDGEYTAKPKTSHSNEFHTQNQMASNYVPQIFRPSNTLYTLKPVNSKIVINTANLQNMHAKDNNNKQTIHMVHNQLGLMKNLVPKGKKE